MEEPFTSSSSCPSSCSLPIFPIGLFPALDAKYSQFEFLSSGTFGEVFRACNQCTQEQVVVKLFKQQTTKTNWNSSIDGNTYREISLLKELQSCENVVKMIEVVTSTSDDLPTIDGQLPGSISYQNAALVMESLDTSLHSYLYCTPKNKVGHLSIELVQHFTRQLLEAVQMCSKRAIIHRDIKPANLLIDLQTFHLKLADFGLARRFIKFQSLTPQKITLPYRPPEKLLGSISYGPSADMWSVGCVVGELLLYSCHTHETLRNHTFTFFQCSRLPTCNCSVQVKTTETTETEQGETASQLESIFRVCGSPTAEDFGDLLKTSLYFDPKKHTCKQTRVSLAVAFPQLLKLPIQHIANAVDFLNAVLVLNPLKRMTASQALGHPFLTRDGATTCTVDVAGFK